MVMVLRIRLLLEEEGRGYCICLDRASSTVNGVSGSCFLDLILVSSLDRIGILIRAWNGMLIPPVYDCISIVFSHCLTGGRFFEAI